MPPSKSNEMNFRQRDWCFTFNNYTDATEKHIQEHLAEKAKYVVYGKETGANGTPHLQGYIYFKNTMWKTTVNKLFRGGHVEPCKGTPEQNKAYCTKENTAFEHGELPISTQEKVRRMNEKKKTNWHEILQLAEEGNFNEIKERFPSIWVRDEAKLRSQYRPVIQNLETLEHEWWVGVSGTGKSRLVHELYPTHYSKHINKWWCGYEHEETVVIEEWAPGANPGTIQSLKQWADHYRFRAQIKGGNLGAIRPKKIIVLSNYTPEECFEHKSDLEPILRRFTILHFPRDRERAIERSKPVEEEIPDISDLIDEEPRLLTTLEEAIQEYDQINPDEWTWGVNLFNP